MPVGGNYSFNNSYLLNRNVQFRSTAPQNANFTVNTTPEQMINNNSIDEFVKKVDEEKNKKHNKKAIAVGASVIGVSLLVSIFNPRISTKLIEKLKNARSKSSSKIDSGKNGFFKTKFYEVYAKTADWLSSFLSYTNNINSVKDTYFKKLCTEEKSFFGDPNRKQKQKFDRWFVRIMKKPHEMITKWGDQLARLTVRRKYASSVANMDKLDALIKQYSDKLPPEQKAIFEQKIREIAAQKEYFSESRLLSRLDEQEKIMGDLNGKIRKFFEKYTHTFRNKFVKSKTAYFNDNLSFWAQDMLKADKERIVKNGTEAVDVLFGNSKGSKGSYNEIFELISPYLNNEDKKALQKAIEQNHKKLRSANLSECSEYFDKKRDLVLGSAPTDIVTAIVGVTSGGLAIATADDKDSRISKTLTGIIPAVAGIGTSIALTSMLFSGTKGMLLGAAAGGVMSLAGSGINHVRLNAKSKQLQAANENFNNMEVNNA